MPFALSGFATALIQWIDADHCPEGRFAAGSKEPDQDTARNQGLNNLHVITADVNGFDTSTGRFDRVDSIEMFEHMRNYQWLLAGVSRWSKPDGKLFVHIFTHRQFAYHFESRGPSDWMARYFFTGGQMPAHELLTHFQDDLRLVRNWKMNRRHYQRTAEHWLENLDRSPKEVMEILAETYGTREATKWWAYWRTFFMNCAELWGYRGGNERIVSHYLFEQKDQH